MARLTEEQIEAIRAETRKLYDEASDLCVVEALFPDYYEMRKPLTAAQIKKITKGPRKFLEAVEKYQAKFAG